MTDTDPCPECGGEMVTDHDEEPPQRLCLNGDCLYWEEVGGGRSGGGL